MQLIRSELHTLFECYHGKSLYTQDVNLPDLEEMGLLVRLQGDLFWLTAAGEKVLTVALEAVNKELRNE